MDHEHGKLIDALGGNLRLAERLGGISNKAVSNWRERGVPWRHRPAVARLAEQDGVSVPDDFLEMPSVVADPATAANKPGSIPPEDLAPDENNDGGCE